MTHATTHVVDSSRYAKVVEVSKRIRWEFERDVRRGRSFDFGRKFLPDGLSKVRQLAFLTPDEEREMFGLQDSILATWSRSTLGSGGGA